MTKTEKDTVTDEFYIYHVSFFSSWNNVQDEMPRPINRLGSYKTIQHAQEERWVPTKQYNTTNQQAWFFFSNNITRPIIKMGSYKAL